MRRVAFVVAIIGALLIPALGSGALGLTPRVIGGQGASPTEWANVPVVVGKEGSCSGTLIDPEWVLTAAHCIEPGMRLAGGANAGALFTWIDPKALGFAHPDFDPSSLTNDIGLIHLSSAHDAWGPPRRLAVAEDRSAWDRSSDLFVLGWGLVSAAGDYSDELQVGVTRVPSGVTCFLASGFGFDPAYHGCSTSPTTSTCFGDSGGPAFGTTDSGEIVQVGVNSFVSSGGCDDASFHALVAPARAWIDDMVSRPGPVIGRLGGADRYGTAAALTIGFSIQPARTTTIYVATGEDFADALTAGPVATLDGAPLLLVERDRIPPVTAAELDRFNASRIVVLGGPAAVSDEVVAALGAWAPVTRRAGATRYETASAASAAVFAGPAPRLWLAPGDSFVDGLIAGAAGALRREPMLLVPSSGPLPGSVAAEIARLAPGSLAVVGAVGADVLDQLDHLSGALTVIDDPDPSVRSARVWDGWDAADTVVLATSARFPDGLAGAPYAAVAPAAPLLLVPGTCIPAAVGQVITRLDPEAVVLVGGPAALSEDVAALAPCA